mgnify:CR=1 FL=1
MRQTLIAVLVIVFALVGCGGGNETSSTQTDAGPSVEENLREVRNYVVSELWNEGFVDIDSYIKRGTSSTGETLDIDFTLQQLDYAMEKKPDYDTFILGLEDEKYVRVKQVWEKLSPEIDRLYSKVKEEKPTANNNNYDFDVSLFNQYLDAFIDIVDELNE